jgi:hypothetical protein
MTYTIYRCYAVMSDSELNDYCKQNKCRMVTLHSMPNHPRGQYWYYFESPDVPAADKPKRKYTKSA